MALLDWYNAIYIELSKLVFGFLGFIPKLVGALIIFIIGWLIAIGVGRLVTEILSRLNFDKIFEKGAWKSALEKADFKVDASGFIGAIFKWALMIVFLLAAVDILGLNQLGEFLTKVLAYLPNVVVSAFIFVVAVIIADIAEKVIRAALEGARMGYGHVAGSIIRWSILIFALLAILVQLGIAEPLVEMLWAGIIALFVIAGGISFGLAGKDLAADLLQSVRRRLKG